jgi:outer membrane protein assembly factor BamB
LQMPKNKTTTLIALFLLFAMAFSLVALPVANAHDPPWTIISYAYIVPAPNPVGVGQTVAIVMWIDTPLPSAALTNDIRRHDYTLTITAPDGKIETHHWDVVSDPTSVQSYQFTPDQVGTYTLKFDYDKQTYTWDDPLPLWWPPYSEPNPWTNDTFTAASKTTTLTVQEEELPAPTNSYPLPTEYWTRPIEGQNTDWYAISSNWLGTPYIIGGGAIYGMPGGIQPDGTAPNSPHVMWTKPIQFGGVVGGSNVGVPGNVFYTGSSYNVRYSNPLIMYGTLYYQEPYGNSGSGGDYVAVDLRTGEELWRITPTGGVPSFGYLFDYESPNQHGVLPNGVLIAISGTTWRAYDPRTGVLTSMEVTNVPSGLGVAGPKGEYLKYVITNLGNTTNPDWYLMQWNSSKAFGFYGGFGPSNWYSGTVDASSPSCYDWNISVTLGPGTWSIATDFLATFPIASLDNMVLLTQGSLGGHPGDFNAVTSTEGANITAVNLNVSKGTRGNILWTEHYPPAPGNNTRGIQGWDTDVGVFIFWDKESMALSGYSLANGKKLWSTTETVNDWMFMPNSVLVAYGKAYWTGYGGVTYCYDVKDGSLLWTYGNGGPGNSTSSGLETPWGLYPTFVDVIADGKIYLSTTEHSANTPLYKNALFRCINATDGTEIWTMMGYATNMYGGTDVVADGYFAFLNCYDMQIYCVGKGPSATTVTAAPKVSVHGNSVLVEGMVTDIAAGTTQNEQAARFANGVPAVSDESMGDWMEYVYMQKPCPADVVGVEVVLEVLDPNNNYYEVGRATSDANGMFHCAFTPEVPGEYTIIATFAGSGSYYGSFAETAINVEEAPAATPAPTPTPAPMTDTYILGSTIGIIIAIVVVGLLLFLLLRKR